MTLAAAGSVTVPSSTCTNLAINPPSGEYISSVSVNYGSTGVTYLSFVTTTGSTIAAGVAAESGDSTITLKFTQANQIAGLFGTHTSNSIA